MQLLDECAQLRAEWSEKLPHLQRKIEELEFDASRYLDDLDVALVLMTRLDVFYKRMEFDQRTKLLQLFVKRIIINPEGEIIGHELHSPFAYLSALSDGQNGPEEDQSGSEQVRLGSLPYMWGASSLASAIYGGD